MLLGLMDRFPPSSEHVLLCTSNPHTITNTSPQQLSGGEFILDSTNIYGAFNNIPPPGADWALIYSGSALAGNGAPTLFIGWRVFDRQAAKCLSENLRIQKDHEISRWMDGWTDG